MTQEDPQHPSPARPQPGPHQSALLSPPLPPFPLQHPPALPFRRPPPTHPHLSCRLHRHQQP